jgi:hypothetical protein
MLCRGSARESRPPFARLRGKAVSFPLTKLAVLEGLLIVLGHLRCRLTYFKLCIHFL